MVLESELLYNVTFDMSPETESSDYVTPIGKAKVINLSLSLSFSLSHSFFFCMIIRLRERALM